MLGNSCVAAQLAASHKRAQLHGVDIIAARARKRGDGARVGHKCGALIPLQKPYKYMNTFNIYFKKNDFLSNKRR
jgi:hypothetical protein